jgi:murein DD-endopeptidase MepM/ murein hydrolase activator NlpD
MKRKSERICFIVSLIAITVLLVSAIGSASATGFLTLPADINPYAVYMYVDTPENRAQGWPTYDGHQGTDYKTNEGTPIFAAADGYAYIHKDTEGPGIDVPNTPLAKGGLGYFVDIDHSNGYWTRYAHLKESGRVYGSVKQGQFIGYASNTGAPWGRCYTPHLHFEVRKGGAWGAVKDPYASTDWLWTTNPPSKSSAVSTQTSWHFNIPGNTEGWEAHNVVAYCVVGGGYFIDPVREDPWIQSASLSIDASKYNAIEINMASNCPDNNAAIFFTTATSSNYAENKKVPFKIRNNGNWQTYTIYMANHDLWKGTITRLRIDPAENGKSGTPSDTVGFDHIKLIICHGTIPNKELSADLNCDNKVNIADFAILMGYWGTNGFGATSCRSPDINHDGIVDDFDFSIMMSQWTG